MRSLIDLMAEGFQLPWLGMSSGIRHCRRSLKEPKCTNRPQGHTAAFSPILQAIQVGERNLALFNSIEEMLLPQTSGKLRESNLRQWRLSRRLRESVPVRLLLSLTVPFL